MCVDPTNCHGQCDQCQFPYIYFWRRCGRKDQMCKVTARGKKNSIRVEFPDGFKMITSGNSIRRVENMK